MHFNVIRVIAIIFAFALYSIYALAKRSTQLTTHSTSVLALQQRGCSSLLETTHFPPEHTDPALLY